MKTPPDWAHNVESLLKRLGTVREPAAPGSDDPIAVLTFSFFLWESTTNRAVEAWRNFTDAFIDYNELRVSLPYEMVAGLRLRDSRALDRCQRLRASLNEVFRREHVVSLDRIKAQGKRDVRRYLDGLEGMVPYVAERICVLCFETHSIPVDEQLRALLIEEAAADPVLDLNELSAWVSRHVKATNGRAAHFALQAWSDRAFARLEAGAAGEAAPVRRGVRKRESGGGAPKRKVAPARKS